MFHKFNNVEDRSVFRGPAYIEIQYCRLKQGTKLKKLVAVNSIKLYQDDSLYLHSSSLNDFMYNYSSIFGKGTYNNLHNGFIDPFGINYYSLEDITKIREKLMLNKPVEYQTLLKWLDNGSDFNGVYILGI